MAAPVVMAVRDRQPTRRKTAMMMAPAPASTIILATAAMAAEADTAAPAALAHGLVPMSRSISAGRCASPVAMAATGAAAARVANPATIPHMDCRPQIRDSPARMAGAVRVVMACNSVGRKGSPSKTEPSSREAMAVRARMVRLQVPAAPASMPRRSPVASPSSMRVRSQVAAAATGRWLRRRSVSPPAATGSNCARDRRSTAM